MNAPQINPALMQMEDIVLPQPISQLPIAPGYWLVAIIIIAAGVITFIKLRKRAKYHAPRKAALAQLQQLDINDSQYPSQINSLLKRTALSYLPRQDFAQLDGDQWFKWLELRLPQAEQGQIGLLLAKRYQACGLNAAEKQQLFKLAKSWLTQKARFAPLNAIKSNANSANTQANSPQEASCSL
ncbi:DUF4381 domain-containing protein [Shewanella sp. 10N.286.52.B9]|uniref:DUF4381 domain-containing protein n=1 Tax=Shewanella sp. 10N.286.52.B9 TaxID=1880837 RepID=UPI000C862015|nr:DUF4381 domain-containing protein [Shewanella sp. 10N.286.52.B9]PMG51770.1 hypothetical protein BCU91_16065 [Shewanella sp. 10N.286.52.B9]